MVDKIEEINELDSPREFTVDDRQLERNDATDEHLAVPSNCNCTVGRTLSELAAPYPTRTVL